MRIAFIAPFYYPAQSGNAVTVRRIAAELERLGCAVEVFSIDQFSSEELVERLKRFRPDFLHAFHAYRGGRMAHALARELRLPFLITLTGTDVYQSLIDQHAFITREALQGAVRLVAFHPSIKRRVAEQLPTVEDRIVVIPQGVPIPEKTVSDRKPAEVVFLLPAGVRRVKNVLFPLKPLAELYQREPGIRFELVGPVLDPEYAVEVLDAMESCPFAHYQGGVRHDEMTELYRDADIVINCSLFEGGMANAVLEGMAYGKALLVSDIEGNRSLIEDGVTGLLYRDAAEFVEKAQRLVTDPRLREQLGQAARTLVQTKYPPEQEGRAYYELYREILGKP
ncbi:GPMC system family 4 glycosyltransferase [Geomesophilobacter sediminis]|uniref:GPMC system family 4 glycosyltransferase n=1 Tax=Geomesophilobacter sediminis TaxID=2798584 RepID=A0A8J7M0U8_9BACT|nr:GPMC system family 4 glycosyltransferase [Geomesophilobacter sediminis]MBJ6726496.1 GPMC system family 4 glycosyltransferase [Geomesophilobacter sediminis]